MSHKKKADTAGDGTPPERQPVNNTPQKRIEKEIRKGTQAFKDAQEYADTDGFTWIELATRLKIALDAATAAWGCATRESLRPPGEQGSA